MEHSNLPTDTPIAATSALSDFLQEKLLLDTFAAGMTRMAQRMDGVKRTVINGVAETSEGWGDDASVSQTMQHANQILKGKTQSEKIVRSHDQLLQHLTLSRAVDNFLAYISDLLTLIFKSKPSALRSEKEEVDLELIFEHQSLEDLISTLTDRRVTGLSFKSLQDLTDYLDTKLGFSLFEEKGDLERAVRIVETRNIIVHNRGQISRLFKERLPSYPGEVGEFVELDPDEVLEDLEFLSRSAVFTDDRAVNKFGLRKVKIEEAPGFVVEMSTDFYALQKYEEILVNQEQKRSQY